MPGLICSYDRLSPPVFVRLRFWLTCVGKPAAQPNNNRRKLDDVDSPWHRSV